MELVSIISLNQRPYPILWFHLSNPDPRCACLVALEICLHSESQLDNYRHILKQLYLIANTTARDLHEAGTLYRRAAAATSVGVTTPAGTKEHGVAATAGKGATVGLPTTDDAGVISMNIHQVNQDGAGPYAAMVDATSGGTDAAAFKAAEMVQNVPGIGVAGISTASIMDFPAKMQMPAGMTCSGTVAGASNVCVAKMSNGPPQFFGGSIAFTQSPAAKKRAIEYNMKMRRDAKARRAESH